MRLVAGGLGFDRNFVGRVPGIVRGNADNVRMRSLMMMPMKMPVIIGTMDMVIDRRLSRYAGRPKQRRVRGEIMQRFAGHANDAVDYGERDRGQLLQTRC